MIDIKQASLLHLNSLHPLFEEYRAFYKMEHNELQSKKFLKQRLSQKDSLIFTAFKAHHPVGFVQIYPLFSSVAMQKTWLLNDLYVTKTARQQGIATKLIKTVENEAKKSNIFSIKLATAIDNHNAKALYQSLGYQPNQAFAHYSKKIKNNST